MRKTQIQLADGATRSLVIKLTAIAINAQLVMMAERPDEIDKASLQALLFEEEVKNFLQAFIKA